MLMIIVPAQPRHSDRKFVLDGCPALINQRGSDPGGSLIYACGAHDYS